VDSGIGLAEDQLGQLFQPFQQADASVSRRYGGSGLGLALCQQLARLLGGSIGAESTLGVGSVFTLEVPVQRAGVPARPAAVLAGQRITLLSAAAEWRLEIGGLLQRAGADVTVLEQPPLEPVASEGATLLLFGERRAWSADDEAALVARHRYVVRAYANGPLSPQPMDDGVHVSCYAGQSLLRALGALHGAVSALPPAPPAAAVSARGRVLLVEDNPINRELIQQQLEALGFTVDTAEDGKEGLLAWRQHEHLAVLTDINMPVMDGYALARALRERAASLPILAITATALASERERCRQAGITDLLLKPLNLETLGRVLLQHLGPMPGIAGEAAVRPARPADVAPPGGGMVLPDHLRRTFVNSSRDDLQRIARARADQDQPALLDRVHALKGVLMMLGQRGLGERFSEIEAQLREGGTVDATALDGVIQALQALVDQQAAQLGAG